MYKNILLLLLILAQPAFACEDELTLHPLTQVIVAAVDQGFAPMDKVQRWVGRRGQGNPLTGIALRGKGLSYRQGIQDLLGELSPLVLGQVQAQLEKREHQNAQKEQAQEKVRPIVSLKEVGEWERGTDLTWSPPEAGTPMLALLNSRRKVEIRRPFEAGAPVHIFDFRFLTGDTPKLTWGTDAFGQWKLWIASRSYQRIFVGDLSSSELQTVPMPNLATGEFMDGWINIHGMPPLLKGRYTSATLKHSQAYSLSPEVRTVFRNAYDPPDSACWLRDKKNQLLVLNKASSGVQISYASLSNSSAPKPPRMFKGTEAAQPVKLLQTKSGRILAIYQKDEYELVLRAPFERGFRQITIDVGDKIWGTVELIEFNERLIMAVPVRYEGENGHATGIVVYEPLLSDKSIWEVENLDYLSGSLKMWIESGRLFLGASSGKENILIAEPLMGTTYPLFRIQNEVRTWVEFQGQMYFTNISDDQKDKQKNVLYKVMK